MNYPHDNIQVQFHHIDSKFDKYKDKFCNALSQTHQLTYKMDWIWENWQIKSLPFECTFNNFNKLIEEYLKLEKLYNELSEDYTKDKEKLHNIRHAVDLFLGNDSQHRDELKQQMRLN